MSSTMTIRLEDGIKNRLDQLAQVTQRSKSFLAAEAIAAYVDTNEWQLAEIQAALSEAQARDFASDQVMADLALKWHAGAHSMAARCAAKPGRRSHLHRARRCRSGQPGRRTGA